MERRSTPILGRTGRGSAVAARESFQMMPPARRHYAYLLRCGDGTYYAGYTVHPGRRLAAHRRGRASRYTRGRGPHTYAAVFWCPTKRSALVLERLLKRLPHSAKRRLARGRPPAALAEALRLGVRRLPVFRDGPARRRVRRPGAARVC